MQQAQPESADKLVMLLTTPRSYRLEAFRQAAAKLGVQVVTGLDLPPQLAEQWPDALPLTFRDNDTATAAIVAYADQSPITAILSVDDSGSLLAASASAALGLPHNKPAAATAARNKLLMRVLLQQAGVPSPQFGSHHLTEDPGEIAANISFPVVIKPVDMNGSRGVIRANDPQELSAAIDRLRRIVAGMNQGGATTFLVESYIPGVEVAVEGLLDDGHFHMLALFDKPDPLEGPFFEETIYVTPSRLPDSKQDEIRIVTLEAAKAIGLSTGPVHAELRLNQAGTWIVEIAGRSIGGLCSDVLRFGIDASLEELILRQACGLPLGIIERANHASGVMMIPIPAAGLLREVRGVEAAAAEPFIDRVEISAPLDYPLVPLPEGDSYLGFIFARGETPEIVEQALRNAHAQLAFTIDPVFELTAA